MSRAASPESNAALLRLPELRALLIARFLASLGMAAIAWFLPSIGPKVALFLTFVMLIWQGLGGGFTAPPWHSMIGKIIPPHSRGVFFGFQMAAMNLLLSGSAILAGVLLERFDSPYDFSLCFILASLALIVSYIFLAQTRETENPPSQVEPQAGAFWQKSMEILRRDSNFRWFLAVRMLSQLAPSVS